MKLNQDQSLALSRFKKFLTSKDQVFILKGYAGTGKTSLIKEYVYYLKSKKRQPILMASTGRAARILFEKTGFTAETVHRTIYHIEETGLSDDESYRYTRFNLQQSIADIDAVYICDESSMLSNKKIFNKELSFGSGRLLTDLITHIGNRKIVFVGDPAQLPPVNAIFSPALNADFFKNELNIRSQSSSLCQIMRYKSGTGKYDNTVRLRENIEMGRANVNPFIYAKSYNDYHVYTSEEQLISSYTKLIKEFGIDQMCFVANSNSKVFELNENIRKIVFKGRTHKINIGEPLLVMQNNYIYNLYNGDNVEVVSVSEDVEHRAGINFRKVVVQTFDKEGMIRKECLIIDDLLYMNIVNLNSEQETKLYQDFIIRLSKRGITEKSENFNQELKSDLYLNALKVKFGYAMTCHKAQGGEWAHLFLVLEKHLFTVLPKETLHRWLYTALSRASSNVHLAPNYCIR